MALSIVQLLAVVCLATLAGSIPTGTNQATAQTSGAATNPISPAAYSPEASVTGSNPRMGPYNMLGGIEEMVADAVKSTIGGGQAGSPLGVMGTGGIPASMLNGLLNTRTRPSMPALPMMPRMPSMPNMPSMNPFSMMFGGGGGGGAGSPFGMMRPMMMMNVMENMFEMFGF